MVLKKGQRYRYRSEKYSYNLVLLNISDKILTIMIPEEYRIFKVKREEFLNGIETGRLKEYKD